MAHSYSFVLRFVVTSVLCHLKHHSEIYYQALEETATSLIHVGLSELNIIRVFFN